MTQADKEFPLLTSVDDETYDELTTLIGERIVHVALWEDSLADALSERPASADQQTTFDLDLYLEGGVYFEMYGVACFDLQLTWVHSKSVNEAERRSSTSLRSRTSELSILNTPN
jgi:hypothetical protein